MPLIFALIFSVAVVIIAFALEGNRDMGAGYLPEREGRAYAKSSRFRFRAVCTSESCDDRLVHRFRNGCRLRSIYGDMQMFLESNEVMQQMFTQAGVSLKSPYIYNHNGDGTCFNFTDCNYKQVVCRGE